MVRHGPSRPPSAHGLLTNCPQCDAANSIPPAVLRDFTDYSGITWRVWDVTPQSQNTAAKRGIRITPVDGWLVFESDTERRRLSPIPEGWESGDNDALCYLCARAKVVPRHAPGTSRDATA